MAQKFIGLEDAAKQLGVTKDQLNALREAGELRGYRDGASWKFRTEEIDGLPESGKLSGGAGADDEVSLDTFGAGIDSGSLDLSDDLDLDLGSFDISGDLGGDAPPSPESDPELAAVDEPTVAADEDEPAADKGAADEDDDELVLDTDASDDDAESILLTDASVGGATDRPPSTIIGKSELASLDDDLELAPGSDVGPATSDVKLVSDDAEGGDFSSASSEAASKFEGLEELEIDLEAESSRILEANDVAAAQAAAKRASEEENKGQPDIDALDSDLSLATGSDAASLTGLSQLGGDGGGDDFELAAESSLVMQDPPTEKKGPGSSAVLGEDDDDDMVLGGEGSDITLSGADSGINLVPSDSGIALDDASLDLTGAAGGGSSLDLSESFGAALTDGGDDSLASAEVSGEQDFLLQPVADDESDEEDSSQIIALEEVGEDDSDEVMISDAVGFGAADDAAIGVAPAGVAVEEAQFGPMTLSVLTCSVLSLFVCGWLSVDMIRTIWSWHEPSTIGSGILDSLSNLMGLRS